MHATAEHTRDALYLYIDEAGNFDFGHNGTRYFVLTGVLMWRPFAHLAGLLDIKYDVLEEGLDLEYFHASEDRQAVRDQVLACLEPHLADLATCAIVIRKRGLAAEMRRAERLYPAAFSPLIEIAMAGEEGAELPSRVIVVTDTLPARRERLAVTKAVKLALHERARDAFEYRILHHASRAGRPAQLLACGAVRAGNRRARGSARLRERDHPSYPCGRVPWPLVTAVVPLKPVYSNGEIQQVDVESLIRLLAGKGRDSLTLLGDMNQRIHGEPLDLEDLHISVEGRTFSLAAGCRTTREIAELGQRIFPAETGAVPDIAATLDAPACGVSGPLPETPRRRVCAQSRGWLTMVSSPRLLRLEQAFCRFEREGAEIVGRVPRSLERPHQTEWQQLSLRAGGLGLGPCGGGAVMHGCPELLLSCPQLVLDDPAHHLW